MCMYCTHKKLYKNAVDVFHVMHVMVTFNIRTIRRSSFVTQTAVNCTGPEAIRACWLPSRCREESGTLSNFELVVD